MKIAPCTLAEEKVPFFFLPRATFSESTDFEGRGFVLMDPDWWSDRVEHGTKEEKLAEVDG